MDYHPLHEAVTTIPEFRPRKVKTNRKTIAVALFLIVMLAVSQIFSYGYQESRPPKMSVSRVYGSSFLSLNELAERPSCMKTYLGSHRPLAKEEGTCRHLSPPRGFCSLLQELFSKKPDKCLESSIKFCTEKSGIIKCDVSPLCRKNQLFIGQIKKENGQLTWTFVQKSTLTESVKAAIRSSSYQGFVFIGCNTKDLSKIDPIHHQLFVSSHKWSEDGPQKPSVNLVMLDSVSRHHFYRSLPRSIDALETMKNVEILDFSYLQAISHQTFENLQALLAGYVDLDLKDLHEEVQKKQLPVQDLLKQLKNQGYSVHWLEDFCWNSKHGLYQYLNVSEGDNSWNNFMKTIKEAHIDDMGVSYSSCELLRFNGRTDPSHNSTSVCYNGQFQHEYILRYLESLQTINQNLFTFTHLNVGNDYSGVRIQTLDESLQRYMKFASSLPNTLTIIFSNHGNNNGMLVESSAEGYIEAFNPFLFMIIPPKINNQLQHIGGLKHNQDKLITLLDVHPLLMSLLKVNLEYDSNFQQDYGPERGILDMIPDERNCNDLPLVMPNLCICRGFDIHVPPSGVHSVLADFAVGTINNLILHQRYIGGKRGFGSCQILQVSKIRNVHELRTTADTIQYKLDVDVLPLGVTKKGAREIFFFVLQVNPSNPGIKFLSYDRISAYKFYSGCCDPRVDLKLCVCDAVKSNAVQIPFLSSLTVVPKSLTGFLFSKPTNATVVRQQIKTFVQTTVVNGKTSIELEYPKRFACVYIVKHEFEVGFNLFAISACQNLHKIILRIENRDYYLSGKMTTQHLIHFNELKLLMSGLQINEDTSQLEYNIQIVPFG